MSATRTTLTEAISAPLATLNLRGAADANTSWSPDAADQPDRQVEAEPEYPYAQYLPYFNQDYKLPPLTPFEHVDPGAAALTDPEPRKFLENATKVAELAPKIGTEIEGVQLHKLNDREKQQLALFVAQRGLVVFRDQEFQDQGPEWLKDWGRFFGRLHVHPTSGQPKDHPEFHLVYRDGKASFNFETSDKLTSSVWHSDVTYEEQPPGLTTLFLFDSPPSGGDTAYVSQVEAYKRLSPSFREYLETLSVVHSGVEQAEFSRKGNRGGVVKREPVENIHPLVRVHPLTGEKALYVNKQFSRRIVGLKTDESDAILNLLYNHIATGIDFQTRVRWAPRSVVLWDNRITAHSAIVDFDSEGSSKGRRHGLRITPQAERPIPARAS